MTTKLFYKAIFFWAAVFISVPVIAQNRTTVSAKVDRSAILIGEPILLTLEVDVPENEAIRFFALDSLPHFEFLSKERIDTSNTGSGTVLSQVIRITSFDSGHWVIPALILIDSIQTDTIPVDVGFSPFDPQQPYHDVKDIIEVNPEQKKDNSMWWYLGGGALLLLILLVVLLTRKKKPVVKAAEPPPDPYKKAMERLEKLRLAKPAAKEYYSELTDIFRLYIAEKKGIHSLQKTTDDLVLQLRGLTMPSGRFEELAQSLQLADFVKFAKYVPTGDDDNHVFDVIKNIIQHFEQAP